MFPVRVKALRERLKMNKREFSAALGLPYTTYNNYETGQREPSSDVLILIADKYGVSIDWLLGNDAHIEKAPTEPKPGEGSKTQRIGELTPHESALIDKYRSIDAHGVELVDYVVEHERRRCADGGQTLIAARGGGGIRKGKIPDEILNAPGSDNHEPGL